MKPIVAIIGRPNVGKSTLFNRMVGKRLAVVESIPGLTRDRIYGDAEWDGKSFSVVDTGGLLLESDEDILRQVAHQAFTAVEEADVVIMMMDANDGLLPSDVELNAILRKYGKKVFYVVNKVDGPSKERALYDFYSLGENVYPLSALNGYGFDELMNGISSILPDRKDEKELYPRVAIVGRPNVGKSTLVNSLLGKNRMIVSSVPGTTRDAVNSQCKYHGKIYTLIDTAGIRKKGKMTMPFERYSFLRTLRNIENCDVAIILINAVEGIVDMDQKIGGLAHDSGKGVIVCFNKWDLTDKSSRLLKSLTSEFHRKFWFLQYAPLLTVSALNRQRVTKLFPLIDGVIEESVKRIDTHELNEFLKKSMAKKSPPLYKGRQVKIYYMTQTDIKPPEFVLFTNKKDGVKPDYMRFLERQLREEYSFKGVPLRFYIKQREK
jgi:GTP-binding protein